MGSRFDGISGDARKILDRAAGHFPMYCSLTPDDLRGIFPGLGDNKKSYDLPYIGGLCRFLISEGYLRDDTSGGPRLSLVALTAKGLKLYGWSESDLKPTD